MAHDGEDIARARGDVRFENQITAETATELNHQIQKISEGYSADDEAAVTDAIDETFQVVADAVDESLVMDVTHNRGMTFEVSFNYYLMAFALKEVLPDGFSVRYSHKHERFRIVGDNAGDVDVGWL